jgi:hypothetical protein
MALKRCVAMRAPAAKAAFGLIGGAVGMAERDEDPGLGQLRDLGGRGAFGGQRDQEVADLAPDLA